MARLYCITFVVLDTLVFHKPNSLAMESIESQVAWVKPLLSR